MKKIIPNFFLSFYHFSLAFLGTLFYGLPSKKIKVIGITGTNGKTTVSEMVNQIFEKAGFKVALSNSIRFKIDKSESLNKLRMTMPGRAFLQKFLRGAIKENCQYAILEVTSEGIKQYRHKFINFEIAVFTNLSPEHIEAHGSYEKYREAKGKLFQETKNIHIINTDDKEANFFLKFPAKRKITFGLEQGEINNRELNLKLKIPGQFNIYNALAAISIAYSQGVDKNFAKEVVENFEGAPGRMELVIAKPFKVFVDYAFTPAALEKVYQTLIKLNNETHKSPSNLICVLGSCGGGRDRWKRPVLGALAKNYCQEVIITNEDPYNEDPMEIINQVAKGVGEKAKKILDRREAIREALKIAKENDIVIITGKGCEPSICIKGKKIPWDDRDVVREEFNRLFNQQ